MYVRFVIQQKDQDSGRRQGLFQAIRFLESHATLRPEERALLDETYGWFKQSLRVPDRLSRSTRPHAHRVALSWYKDSAAEHIGRMRTLAGLLGAHGYTVEMLKTDRPGFIVYEDDTQIAAEPFADTPV
jgi:hypothetical protein